MSRSATPATRNEATTRLKPPKMTTSAELPIGTAIRTSYERLRTVADGCGRLRTVADADATSSEHTLNPQTPRVKREPLLRIREQLCYPLVKVYITMKKAQQRRNTVPNAKAAPSPSMATGSNQSSYYNGKSPFSMAKSPCSMAKSPCSMAKSTGQMAMFQFAYFCMLTRPGISLFGSSSPILSQVKHQKC